mmetsp:Transcript_32051/g.31767  ORF Transcript_32051/g.31767 Transcript_32051/m.31767 type:complete len:96 (-) Transcript_32051:191-478(-)
MDCITIAEDSSGPGQISERTVLIEISRGVKTPIKNREIRAHAIFWAKPNKREKRIIETIPIIIKGLLPHLSHKQPQIGDVVVRPNIIENVKMPTQ